MNKKKNLLKNTGIFFLSSFIPKTISFFLIPLYTTRLSTSDYGIYDLINTTVALFIPFFTLNLRDAILRYSIKNKQNRDIILKGSLQVILINTIIFLILALILIIFLPNIFNLEYLWMFLWYLLVNSLYELLIAFCKGIENLKAILAASLVNSIITLLLNLVLVFFMNTGLTGFLIANITGTMIATLVCFIMSRSYKFLNNKKCLTSKLFREMILYSAPMIISALAWWINSASDKYILVVLLGTSISGIYATASKIPTILYSFQSVFMQAWSISAITHYNKEDEDNFINETYESVYSLLFLICSFILLFLLPISNILFRNDFNSAWFYVPPLLLSVIFDSLAIFIGQIFYAAKDTKSRMWATVYGAFINTAFNLLLIPISGAYGASIATLIGYLSSFIYSSKKANKYIKLRVNTQKFYSSIIFLILQITLYAFNIKLVILQIVLFLAVVVINSNDIRKLTPLQLIRKLKENN